MAEKLTPEEIALAIIAHAGNLEWAARDLRSLAAELRPDLPEPSRSSHMS